MGWGEEHHREVGTNDVRASTPCSWCKGHHSGRCPQVRAIEYHPNGVVKRVEFVGDIPLPSPALPIVNVSPGRVIINGDDLGAPQASIAPDIAGRDLGPTYPQITAVGP